MCLNNKPVGNIPINSDFIIIGLGKDSFLFLDLQGNKQTNSKSKFQPKCYINYLQIKELYHKRLKKPL